MRKLCVFNRKGGVGKSTIVSILLNTFQEMSSEFKVLCIDLDGQQNAGLYLGIGDNLGQGLDAVYEGNCEVEESIFSINDNLGYVHIENEERFNKNFALAANPSRDFKKLVKLYENIMDPEYEDEPYYDFIVFDLGPNKSILNICALEYVEDIFVPLELTKPSVKGLIDVSVVLRNELEDEDLDKIKLIIPNKYQKNTNSSKDNFGTLMELMDNYFPQLKSRLGQPIFQREAIKNFTEGKVELPQEVKDNFRKSLDIYLGQLKDEQ